MGNLAIRRIILTKTLPEKDILTGWRDLEQAFFEVFENPVDGATQPLYPEPTVDLGAMQPLYPEPSVDLH